MTDCPAPDIADIPYGPHERQRMDLWLAKTAPAPLVVAIHGGAWWQSGKEEARGWDMIPGCLAAGVSVAAINYRLSQHAPAPSPMADCARAIQFLRHRAADWGLDPARVAATGVSAGGLNCLWVAFHADMADPASPDPVARQSTRLTCVFAVNTPTFLDVTSPSALEVPGQPCEHAGLAQLAGVAPAALRTPAAQATLHAVSPLYLVTPAAPPIFLLYGNRVDDPMPGDRPGRGIHHSRFGLLLKKRLDEAGVECLFRPRDYYPERDEDAFNRRWKEERVAFLAARLNAPDPA